MTNTTNPQTVPTSRQLNYLRALARRTGTTFTPPRTRQQASAEIQRLKAIRSTGFTFAEPQAEQAARQANDDVALNATRFAADEITGYGGNCTWSQRA
ncbi:MAG: hypothetical protein ACRDNS_17725 [Trebonia sp.]